jgi:hypothetical protein
MEREWCAVEQPARMEHWLCACSGGADVVRSGAISSDGARSGATSSDGALDVRSGAMIVLAWAYLGRKGFVLKRLD